MREVGAAVTEASKSIDCLRAAMAAPYTPGGPPSWSPRMAWGPQGQQAPNTREADLSALSKIWTAALVSILGSILGVAVPLTLSFFHYISFTIPATGSAVTYGTTALYLVLGIGLVGLVISIIAFWFYRDGFLALRPVDPRFASSPTWALMVIIGLIMVSLGLVAVLAGIVQILTCTGTSTTIPASCISLGALLGGLALLVIGAIVLLIGYIGTLVAIWRLGSRYNDALFKVGAVLLIIPYLSIIGQILILVAASGVRKRVEQTPGAGFAPSVTYPPPPPPY